MSDPHGGEHGGGHGTPAESGHDKHADHEEDEELDDAVSEAEKTLKEEEEEEEARLAEEEAKKSKTKVKTPKEILAENEARFAASNLAKPSKGHDSHGHGDHGHGHGGHGAHHTPDGFFKRVWNKSGSGGALIGFGLLKSIDGIENKFKSLYKWVSNFGANEVKKNTPWMQNLWLIGDWLKPDEAPKKPEAHKPHKEVPDETGKNLKKLLEADAKAMAAQVEAKRAERDAEKRKQLEEKQNHERMLVSFMTRAEEYQFKRGDEETKQIILASVEAELPERIQKREDKEYENLLIAHMTQDEQRMYKAPAVTPEEIAAKDTLRQTVEAELSSRAHLAESGQGPRTHSNNGTGNGRGKKK